MSFVLHKRGKLQLTFLAWRAKGLCPWSYWEKRRILTHFHPCWVVYQTIRKTWKSNVNYKCKTAMPSPRLDIHWTIYMYVHVRLTCFDICFQCWIIERLGRCTPRGNAPIHMSIRALPGCTRTVLGMHSMQWTACWEMPTITCASSSVSSIATAKAAARASGKTLAMPKVRHPRLHRTLLKGTSQTYIIPISNEVDIPK